MIQVLRQVEIRVFIDGNEIGRGIVYYYDCVSNSVESMPREIKFFLYAGDTKIGEGVVKYNDICISDQAGSRTIRIQGDVVLLQ